MKASQNLAEVPLSRKSPISKSGVLTLSGFGIRVQVHNGHLELDDGVGLERRRFRLARVGRGLKRLAIIGSDGFVSLNAVAGGSRRIRRHARPLGKSVVCDRPMRPKRNVRDKVRFFFSPADGTSKTGTAIPPGD